MRSSTTTRSATALLFAALAKAQTFTDCNPLTNTSCPTDPALGTTLTTDFTKGASSDWSLADGTTLSYGSNGAIFSIDKATDAPTISSDKYIFFGKVDVEMLAAPGVGMVSSFILESDDLDEIDWEWLGSTDSSVESNFFGKGNTTTYDRAIYHNVATPIETWHTYTIDWDSSAIKWSIDGSVVRTLAYGDALALGGKNYPQTPMRIKMGSWVGCASAADNQPSSPVYGTCQWAGGPADFSKGPFNMQVKTVTIQDYGCATSYEYGDETGSYESIKSIGSCAGGTSVAATAGTSSTATSSPASSSGESATKTTTPAAASTHTTSSGAPTGASNSTSNATTTLATTISTASTVSLSTGTSGSTSTSSAPSAPSQVNSNGASANKKSHFGTLDVAMGVLGLGLGYLFM